MTEEKEFKVVDRRASAGAEESSPAKKEKEAASGDGFVMKEPQQAPSGGPAQVDFSTLVLSLATGALIHLGLTPDPVTKKTQKNVELARQNIDILSLLREKTKGNLTKDEDQLLDNLLAEVRLRYVEASK